MKKNIKYIEKLLRELKPTLKEKFNIREIGIFGSYAREEERKESDINILVEFKESADLSLLDFIGFENYLSDLLKIKVDLVEKNILKPRIGKYVPVESKIGWHYTDSCKIFSAR